MSKASLLDLGEQPLSHFDRPGGFREFCTDILRLGWWSKMEELARAYEDPNIKEIFVPACHGVSKTTTAAALTEFHFSCKGFPVTTSAPTARQVNGLLWRQIRINRLNAKIKLPGKVQQTPNMVVPGRPDWFALGFTTSKPDSAQGAHQDNMLIIVDEAAGIPRWLWTAIGGWTTNPGCKLIAIGNRSTEENYFEERCDRGSSDSVAVIPIGAHDSPNVTYWECGTPKTEEEREPEITGLASDDWIEEKGYEWGKSSVEYQLKVLGRRMSKEDRRAIPRGWIEEGIERGNRDVLENGMPLYRVDKEALDVARQGKDHNALAGLRQNRVLIRRYWQSPDTTNTVNDVAADIGEREYKSRVLIVDCNGVGGPLFDRFCELRKMFPGKWGHCVPTPLDWGKASPEPERAHFLVAWLYLQLRKSLSPDVPESERLILPSEAELAAVGLTKQVFIDQLNARECWWDDKQRFNVQSKSSLVQGKKGKRLRASPDIADAVAMLFYRQPVVEVSYFSG